MNRSDCPFAQVSHSEWRQAERGGGHRERKAQVTALYEARDSRAVKAAPRAAPAAAALPICARTTEIFFYDGANIGEVKTNEEYDGNDGPSSDVERIHRIGPPRDKPDADFAAASRGFTLAWSADRDDLDFPDLAVKPAGAGKFVRLRTGGNMIVSYDEYPYQKFAFAQLSPQMQAAIRAKRPQLAGSASATAGTAAPQQGIVAFPPIEKGYYARDVSCTRAIKEEPGFLSYFDERRLVSFDGGPRINGFESLGGNRYRVRATSYNELGKADRYDFVITINGRNSYIDSDDGTRHTRCPTAQIPNAIRQGWGDLARN